MALLGAHRWRYTDSFLVNIPCMIDARVFTLVTLLTAIDYRTIIAAVGVIINQRATCGRLSYLAVTGSTSDNNFGTRRQTLAVHEVID